MREQRGGTPCAPPVHLHENSAGAAPKASLIAQILLLLSKDLAICISKNSIAIV
jgi:hypothetical protein